MFPVLAAACADHQQSRGPPPPAQSDSPQATVCQNFPTDGARRNSKMAQSGQQRREALRQIRQARGTLDLPQTDSAWNSLTPVKSIPACVRAETRGSSATMWKRTRKERAEELKKQSARSYGKTWKASAGAFRFVFSTYMHHRFSRLSSLGLLWLPQELPPSQGGDYWNIGQGGTTKFLSLSPFPPRGARRFPASQSKDFPVTQPSFATTASDKSSRA